MSLHEPLHQPPADEPHLTPEELAAPRTSLLPPYPGRHHWCVIVPPSHLRRFDAPGATSELHVEIVQHLWERGLGCARFDLAAPELPAATRRRVERTTEILDRLARLDPGATVTVLAIGDAVPVAEHLAREAAHQAWPEIRSLLLLPEDRLRRAPADAALEVAALVGGDEPDDRPRAASGVRLVTKRVLRRLARQERPTHRSAHPDDPGL